MDNFKRTLDVIYNSTELQLTEKESSNTADALGLTMLYSELYYATEKYQYGQLAEKALSHLFQSNFYENARIDNGFVGMLWLLKRLNKIDLISTPKQLVQRLIQKNKALYSYMIKENNWGYYYGGALGCALAIDEPSVYDDFIQHILRRINNNANLTSKLYPEKTNLGFHAGLLGVLALCNYLMKKGIYVQNVEQLQDKIIAIISSVLEKSDYKYLPAQTGDMERCRMCFTYGELQALYHILNTLRLKASSSYDIDLLKLSDIVLRRNTTSNAMITDSCIMIGTVGNILLMRDLPHKFRLNDTEYWTNETSQILEKNGFLTVDRYTNQPHVDFSILTGLCGILLTCDNRLINSEWKNILLLT